MHFWEGKTGGKASHSSTWHCSEEAQQWADEGGGRSTPPETRAGTRQTKLPFRGSWLGGQLSPVTALSRVQVLLCGMMVCVPSLQRQADTMAFSPCVIQRIVYTPPEHEIDSDMFSDLCMYKTTNGKMTNLACLIRLRLEQTFVYEMLATSLSCQKEYMTRMRSFCQGFCDRSS